MTRSGFNAKGNSLDVTLLTPDTVIRRADLVATLEVRLPGWSRNRINKTVGRAMPNELKEVSPRHYLWKDAATWAHRTPKWHGKISDFPFTPTPSIATVTLPMLVAKGTGSALPDILAECQEALALLRRELATARAKIEQLEPLAAIGERQVTAGRRGGRPRRR